MVKRAVVLMLGLAACKPGLLISGEGGPPVQPGTELSLPPPSGDLQIEARVADGPVIPPKQDLGGPKPDQPKPPTTWTLGQVPFAPTSSWNTPISAGASYTALAWPASSGFNYWINWDEYSPDVIVSKPSDPLVQVSIPAGWGYPAAKIPVRVPAGVTGAPGSDGEILIIDGTTVHNFWRFERTSTNAATADSYGKADAIKDSGWGSKSPFLGAGITAVGASMLAGLLVQAETDAGEIKHALQLVVDSDYQKPGFTGEAIAGDGSSSGGITKEGERLAIPPGASMPAGLSPLGQKVFRAMQKYGVFNIDISGGSTLVRAQANAYNAATIDALRKDMNKLIPMLQRVK
jgi:hypothetical protein